MQTLEINEYAILSAKSRIKEKLEEKYISEAIQETDTGFIVGLLPFKRVEIKFTLI